MLRPEDCIPGTLVECVYVGPNLWGNVAPQLVERRIYTLAELVSYSSWVGVLVREVSPLYPHPAFSLDRFRLLPDERLSVFRQMLAPAPKQKERV